MAIHLAPWAAAVILAKVTFAQFLAYKVYVQLRERSVDRADVLQIITAVQEKLEVDTDSDKTAKSISALKVLSEFVRSSETFEKHPVWEYFIDLHGYADKVLKGGLDRLYEFFSGKEPEVESVLQQVLKQVDELGCRDPQV